MEIVTMAFKNPEDKLQWRREYKKRYPEMHAEWKESEAFRRTGKTKEQRESEALAIKNFSKGARWWPEHTQTAMLL